MGSTPSVSYPMPTKEERLLQKEQLKMIQQNEAYNKEMEPFILQEMGYSRDPEGKLYQLSEEERYASFSPEEKQAYDIAKLASEREMKALRGELAIDPATESDLADQLQRLQQRMYNQLGEGWEASSAGQNALSENARSAGIVRDAVRRGEMTTSEQLAQSRQGQMNDALMSQLQSTREPISRGGTIASQMELPLSWYGQQRENVFQSKQAAANLKAQKMGQISGAMPCCYIFLASDPEDELLSFVRKYKDSHFDRESKVAHGYKRLALWLVPAMRKHSIVKKLVRFFMVHPMELYAKAYYEKKPIRKAAFFPIALFWGTVYGVIGGLYGERNWVKYSMLEKHLTTS